MGIIRIKNNDVTKKIFKVTLIETAKKYDIHIYFDDKTQTFKPTRLAKGYYKNKRNWKQCEEDIINEVKEILGW